MAWLLKTLRKLFQRKGRIMLQISLTENATAEQVAKAVSTIGFFVGQETMRLAGNLVGTTAPLAIHAAAPPPPPPPLAGDDEDGEGAGAPPPPPGAGGGGATVVLDSHGLPWDERIHSGKKTQNQDGSWKKRKNIPDTTNAAVVAELRQHYPAPLAPPPPPAAGVGAPPPPPPPPAASTGAGAPPPPAASGELTFAGLMKEVAGYLAAGKLTSAKLTEACQNAGLQNAAELGRPENALHIPVVAAFIRATAGV
jgi:hypothetical protein